MAAGKWADDIPTGGGIYGIWSPDRASIYIGATGNLRRRLLAHRPCVLLGCAIDVALSLPGSSRAERNMWEDRAILAMRRRGINVVNRTNRENHAAHLRHSPERYRELAAMGLGKLSREQRSEIGRRGQAAMSKDQLRRGQAGLTSEQLQSAGRKGAAARWHPTHVTEN